MQRACANTPALAFSAPEMEFRARKIKLFRQACRQLDTSLAAVTLGHSASDFASTTSVREQNRHSRPEYRYGRQGRQSCGRVTPERANRRVRLAADPRAPARNGRDRDQTLEKKRHDRGGDDHHRDNTEAPDHVSRKTACAGQGVQPIDESEVERPHEEPGGEEQEPAGEPGAHGQDPRARGNSATRMRPIAPCAIVKCQSSRVLSKLERQTPSSRPARERARTKSAISPNTAT